MDALGWNEITCKDFGDWSATKRSPKEMVDLPPEYGLQYVSVDFNPVEREDFDMQFAYVLRHNVQQITISENTILDEQTRECGKIINYFAVGGFGKICKCLYKESECIGKFVDLGGLQRRTDVKVSHVSECAMSIIAFFAEAAIHSVLSMDEKRLCPQLYTVACDKNIGPVIFSEIMEGILDNVREYKERKVQVFTSIVTQMCDAIDYLQTKYKFIHGDLKTNNIGCYCANGWYRFVLIDFGFSSLTFDGNVMCTSGFITPEQYVAMQFPNSADLALLLCSCHDKFFSRKRISRFIKKILTFPNESTSLLDSPVYVEQWDGIRNIYVVCYGCHNPKTTPVQLKSNLLYRFQKVTDYHIDFSDSD